MANINISREKFQPKKPLTKYQLFKLLTDFCNCHI